MVRLVSRCKNFQLVAAFPVQANTSFHRRVHKVYLVTGIMHCYAIPSVRPATILRRLIVEGSLFRDGKPLGYMLLKRTVPIKILFRFLFGNVLKIVLALSFNSRLNLSVSTTLSLAPTK